MDAAVWADDRLDDLVALCAVALPDEALTADELSVCWWDKGSAVLGVEGGAVAAARRGPVGHVRLVAVAPDRQRRGTASRLLDAAHRWLADAACTTVTAGGEAPFYLWPGVDSRFVSAVGLFEAAGYETGEWDWVNMAYSSSFRSAPAPEIDIRRAMASDDAIGFVARHWPDWIAEVSRGVDRGTCFVAVDSTSDAVVGFVCHSVVRTGWLGPMGTDPDRQHGGVGRALLSAVAEAVEATGRDTVDVEWVGPKEFYAKAAGARVNRIFKRMSRPL